MEIKKGTMSQGFGREEITHNKYRLHIYTHEDGMFSIAADDLWLPGVYCTREVAIKATEYSDRDLNKLIEILRSEQNKVEVILTEEDLKRIDAWKSHKNV